jgi:hypothetical protein
MVSSNKSLVFFGIAFLGLFGVGFLGTSISLSAQDFGASDRVSLNNPISDADVNFRYDFSTNSVSSCLVTTNEVMVNHAVLRCYLSDENGDLLSSGYAITNGIDSEFELEIENPPRIDAVESVKIYAAGSQQ